MPKNHDFAVAPRDPERFVKAAHFDDAYNASERFVTSRMVRETIEDGEAYPSEGGDGKERRRKDYNGVLCVLVIDHREDPAVLVTAWTELRHRAEALASGEWKLEELAAIQSFIDSKHTRHGRFEHNGGADTRPLDVELDCSN